MSAGLTPAGFVKRTIDDVLQQYRDDEHGLIGESLDVGDNTPIGQLNGIFAKFVAELWDAAQAEYTAFDPDKNEDDAQDGVAAITGAVRQGATRSQVRAQLGLNGSTTVPVGSLASVSGNPAALFRLVGAEAVAGIVVPGNVVSTSAGTYNARFEATVTGPLVANAGTLAVIQTPVTGWNSVTNGLDAALGRSIESNSAFRQRREDELQAAGSSPVDALRADLLALPGMLQVTVFENVADTTDGTGLPGHQVEALVFDGPSPTVANTAIAQVVWGKAAGIGTHGSTSANAIDAQGGVRVMSFSRPTQRPVYFDISVRVTALYPGDTALRAAIVAFAEDPVLGFGMGASVVLSAFYPAIFGVGGVVDITAFKAGFSPSPTGTTNLAIASRELATFDTSRITVTHV